MVVVKPQQSWLVIIHDGKHMRKVTETQAQKPSLFLFLGVAAAAAVAVIVVGGGGVGSVFCFCFFFLFLLFDLCECARFAGLTSMFVHPGSDDTLK